MEVCILYYGDTSTSSIRKGIVANLGSPRRSAKERGWGDTSSLNQLPKLGPG